LWFLFKRRKDDKATAEANVETKVEAKADTNVNVGKGSL